MRKYLHEFLDPIHVFIKIKGDEREIIDSKPFQRLRNISQLGLTSLLYPGATHRRFEHSLGVMELATRIFDTVFSEHNVVDKQIEKLQIMPSKKERDYWRQTLRVAALCHDLGHLPFSHSAERELMPDGYDHEIMTIDIIRSDEMQSLYQKIDPAPAWRDIIKLSIGPKKLGKHDNKIEYTSLEAILSEIIVSDTFGADRMDYLLRDSYYAGVAYGKFDHYRLIDTLRILTFGDDNEPCLGIEEGGLHSAEALLLARYFMFSQLYYHPIRRIYDIHLNDFLKLLLPTKFSVKLSEFFKWTDNEVLAEIRKAANDVSDPKHQSAKIICDRKHYKKLYAGHPADKVYVNPGEKIYNAVRDKFGPGNVKRDYETKEGTPNDFPVFIDESPNESALNCSHVLSHIPAASIDFVFVSRECYDEAKEWLQANKKDILERENEGA